MVISSRCSIETLNKAARRSEEIIFMRTKALRRSALHFPAGFFNLANYISKVTFACFSPAAGAKP
jgi:hypothetical protein